MKIILGSGSKSRKRILERAGWAFEVLSADIDEKLIRFEDPKELTRALAKAKADAIFPHIAESAILITADQVVVCNGAIREKPESAEEAREFLRSYALYPAEAVNGICVANTTNRKLETATEISRIRFKTIPDSIIDKLIAEGNIFSQAGAFSAEDPLLAPYVDRIEGSLDGIEGLPLEVVTDLMQKVQE